MTNRDSNGICVDDQLKQNSVVVVHWSSTGLLGQYVLENVLQYTLSITLYNRDQITITNCKQNVQIVAKRVWKHLLNLSLFYEFYFVFLEWLQI